MANRIKQDENVVEAFNEDETRDINGVKRGKGYVEVICGCTSRRYGDAVGKLRVFLDGHLQISCECTPGCTQDKLTPAAFEKHSERESSRNWKNNIWVIMNGEKVPLFKTVLLKYYNRTCRSSSGANKQNGRTAHRDEFVRCTSCSKERRFHLRTKDECRLHHDALLDKAWKCSDHPHDRISCDEDEERASRRKVYRGCTRSPACKGCTSCVCFGCETCCYSDCTCQTCTDFTHNAEV